MGLSIILFSNILLVQVGSSSTEPVWRTFLLQAGDRVMWASVAGTVAGLLVILYTPLHGFLKLEPLSGGQLLLAAGISCMAVLWYELVKASGRMASARRQYAGPGKRLG